MSPALAAIIHGTYSAACDLLELNHKLKPMALLVTPTGHDAFMCDDDTQLPGVIQELRVLAAHSHASAVVLVTPGTAPTERIQVAIFYAEVVGASWVAHCAIADKPEASQPTLLEPIFEDGRRSAFHPLLLGNGPTHAGVPVVGPDAG